ncbi:hypothetical protein TNCV_121401 [Trichonephila clavipes]|nr:hypothetical protein TNCV_121401 [Trichonephila clavipes]
MSSSCDHPNKLTGQIKWSAIQLLMVPEVFGGRQANIIPVLTSPDMSSLVIGASQSLVNKDSNLHILS